jgi:hypothetical protein
MKKQFYFFAIFFLGIISCSYSQEYKNVRPEVSQYCKVYHDNENLQVSTTRIGIAENNEILIEIFGIDHPFDKKIFKAKVNEYNTNTDYIIQFEGKDWVIMTKRGTENSINYAVYLPNKGKKATEFSIIYSKDLSNQCKPEYLLTAFLEQKNNINK